MAQPPDAFYLQQPDGSRFCLHYPVSTGPVRGLCLYLHPLTEEMNKSRHMAALGARAFSEAGFAVLQIDLQGCGDSSGDFETASWPGWISDVQVASAWLREHYAAAGDKPPALWLWGLRAGCLLAAAAAAQHQLDCHFIFWQPTLSGQQVLNQLLRLKWAEQLQAAHTGTDLTQLRQQLAQGSPVEIAGYTLSTALASGLERAQLVPAGGDGDGDGDGTGTGTGRPMHQSSVQWFDVSSATKTEPSPATRAGVQAWRRCGYTVDVHLVQAPAFWQSSDLQTAPALVDASLAVLEQVIEQAHAVVQPLSGVRGV
jgi:exosortase A-associated hydrolase 2